MTANALHWVEVPRAEQLAEDTHALLRSGGVFAFAEPASPEVPFAAGFEEWKIKQPPRYSQESWDVLGRRLTGFLAIDHTSSWVLAIPIVSEKACPWPAGTVCSKAQASRSTDVSLRDADQAIIAALKS